MQRILQRSRASQRLSPAHHGCKQLPITVRLTQHRMDHAVVDPKTVESYKIQDGADRLDIAALHAPIRNLNHANVEKRLKHSCLNGLSEGEVRLRVELAAAYRLFAHMNWVEAIYNHLTVEITEPDGSKNYLINPLGLRFDEVTASSLLKIDAEGNIKHPGVVGDLMSVNRAGWVIHGGIHLARGDTAKCIMHSHHQIFAGIASTKDGFLTDLSQTSETLGPVATHDFEGIVVDEGERGRMALDLGDCNTLVLRNHGVITMGKSIGAAWYRMYMSIHAAEIQQAAQSAGPSAGGVARPDASTAGKTRDALKYFQDHGDFGTLEFTAFMRLMDKIDPSYRT